jgi:anaerobic ribonucleoside-triphosphate reductase activating protein
MRYNSIKDFDMKQGDGINVSLWTQGCPHRCKGCHNPETWSFDQGKEFTNETIEKIIKLLTKDNIHKNLSILGGEPLICRNLLMLSELVSQVKSRTSAKIWIWTGYTIEELLSEMNFDANLFNILYKVDYIIDGEFIEDEKEDLRYRGSRNQRVIDVKKSLPYKSVYVLEK